MKLQAGSKKLRPYLWGVVGLIGVEMLVALYWYPQQVAVMVLLTMLVLGVVFIGLLFLAILNEIVWLLWHKRL